MNEEIRAQIHRLCEANAFANHVHISLADCDTDRAELEMPVEGEHLNPLGYVHGGALYTLADCAAGIAARTDGRQYVTLTGTLTFLHSGLPGERLRARGQVRRRGRTTCYVEVDISNRQGVLLASGVYTFFCVGTLGPGGD